jgi:CARDB
MEVKTKYAFLIIAFMISLAVAADVMHDIGIVDIIEPVGKVVEGMSITPAVTVQNYGTEVETFNVAFTFKGYISIREVTNLSPNLATTVSFDNWTTNVGNYTTTASVQMAWDENDANNVMQDSFQVVSKLHDIGVTAISVPVGEITQGTKITPKATVKNMGTETESFNVNFSFKGYYSTKKVSNLDPGMTTDINFDSWTATAPADFTAWATTQLPREENPVNNSMKVPFKVIKRIHDVGVTAILDPIGEIPENLMLTPSAKVKNFGTDPESFTVTFAFGDYTSTKKVTRLEPGKTATINFDNWIAANLDDYTVTVTTKLVGDENPNNNALRAYFTVRAQ